MRWRSMVMAVAGALVLAGCTPDFDEKALGGFDSDKVVRGSGRVVSEPRVVRDFTKVDLEAFGELKIERTGRESLTIEAEDNILPLLSSDVSDGVLQLGNKANVSFIGVKPITYRLTVKDLDSITVSGAGRVTAPNLRTGTFTVAISGAGNITVDGVADRQDVEISGAGAYMAEDLESKAAEVTVTGPGSAVVRVSDTLDATISGVGSIQYLGNPTVNRRVTGIGVITKLER